MRGDTFGMGWFFVGAISTDNDFVYGVRANATF